ncbi:MAG: hypothetical protein ACR2RB_15770 [Gammaproteobacteria bacterium]
MANWLATAVLGYCLFIDTHGVQWYCWDEQIEVMNCPNETGNCVRVDHYFTARWIST